MTDAERMNGNGTMDDLLERVIRVLKKTIVDWWQCRPAIIGAAISFYLLFSIGPILVLTIEFTGMVFGRDLVESQIVHEIHTIVGQKPSDLVGDIIAKAGSRSSKRFATIISLPMIVFGAGMVFTRLKETLNLIWGVTIKKPGARGMIRNYMFSFLMVLLLGIVLSVLILKGLVIAAFGGVLERATGFPPHLLQPFDFLITLATLVIIFAAVYKILTEPKIAWSDEWIGAVVTTLLFSISQIFIELYFFRIDIDSAYGAIGSFTIFILWVYYSSLVFLLGAVFTKNYAMEFGSFQER